MSGNSRSRGLSGLTEYSTSTPINRSPNESPELSGVESSTSIPSLYARVDPSFLQEDGTPDYLRLILTSRVYDVCKETPLTPAIALSAKLGCNILLKREDLQPVFSFKIRGAYNMIAQIPENERWKGVIACSAGNHAQGVAYSAKHLNIPATIIMPVPTPSIKYSTVARLGSKVVLFGDDFDEAKAECSRLSKIHGTINIPPFDNPYVIAGQGTIALELLRQVDISKLKAVFCTVGGGGLIAGVGSYIKRIAPHVKVIGVETYDADAMYQSLEKGQRVTLDEVGLFADGAAVKVTGEETFRLCKLYVDEIIRINTDEICAAIKDVFEETRSIMEPSGALPVAAIRKYLERNPHEDKSSNAYVAVLSGANMNFDRLRFVSERAKLGEGSEAFNIVTIPEKRGSFEKLIKIINPRPITEFSYRMASADATDANIYLSYSVSDRTQEVNEIFKALKDDGMTGTDVSDNEFAKTHARYLVGGRASVPNERIFSFEFPERPAALFKFLTGIKSKWSITLFHYRNHGSDVGKVLAGMSVPKQDYPALEAFLDHLSYPYVEETDNPAYQLVLKGA